MAVPPNTSDTTAATITSIPASITLDVQDAPGTTHDVWYKYTAASGLLAISLVPWADPSSNYKPAISVYTGTPGSLSAYHALTNAKKTLQIPVTGGTTYYFKITAGSGSSDPLGSSLTFQVRAGPTSAAPIGSILIPDDTDGFPGAVISATTGEVLHFVNINASERGDSIPGGISAITDFAQTSVVVMDGSFATLATVAMGGTVHSVRSNGVDKFYASKTTTLKSISAAGAVLTTWTLAASGLVIAPDLGETVLYFGASGSTNQPVKRHDLGTDTAMADLVAGVASYAFGNDMIVMADGSLLVVYKNTGVDYFVRRYSTAGATLNTYSFGTSRIGRIARANDATSFWVWLDQVTSSGRTISQFKHINLADGATIATLESVQFEAGVGPNLSAYSSLGTVDRFGSSESCPFFLITEAIPATATASTDPVIDPSAPCCPCTCPPAAGGGSGTGTPSPSGGGTPDTVPAGTTGEVLAPVDPTAITLSCVGGGTVPSASDLTDAEDWAA
jgi:hypothetical protein